MKYMAIIDADEKPVSCEFIGCQGNIVSYVIGTTTNIKALEQESILDKIRAEILEEKNSAYADFEQYKVDYIGVDAEFVEDELPQDDFISGMERAIEIIARYKRESEDITC